MREDKSYAKVREGIIGLKAHSNARDFKNTFYDNINSGAGYKDNYRGGSISMGQRRKSKRGTEMMQQAYHTEEIKNSDPAYYSANKNDAKMTNGNYSFNEANQQQLTDIRKSFTRKKIIDTPSLRRDHTDIGK